MEKENKPVLYGAIAGAALVAAYLGFNHMDIELSVYGGWFENYAWSHADFSMNSGEAIAFTGLVGLGALVGGVAGRVASR